MSDDSRATCTVPDLPLLLKAPEASALVGQETERFLEQHRRPRGLPVPLPRGVKIGRSWFWRRSDLEAWVDATWQAAGQ